MLTQNVIKSTPTSNYLYLYNDKKDFYFLRIRKSLLSSLQIIGLEKHLREGIQKNPFYEERKQQIAKWEFVS